jgi:hypothetical protein
MRELINAYEGYAEEETQEWLRTREICYRIALGYSKHPDRLKHTDIFHLPIDDEKRGSASQKEKAETYKILEKWNK